jgi:hypothetical protein
MGVRWLAIGKSQGVRGKRADGKHVSTILSLSA